MMRAFTLAVFGLFAVAAAALELIAVNRPNRLASLGRLLDAVMSHRAARVVIVLFWWWIGWHFLVSRTVG